MKSLKSGGKAAIVVPEGVLFQTNSAFTQVKQELLEHFNLHTILSLPAGVFLPYSGVKTNVIFFERSGGTTETWFYECEPEQKLTKNKPLNDGHLAEFVELYSPTHDHRPLLDRAGGQAQGRLRPLRQKPGQTDRCGTPATKRQILELIQEKETAVSNLLGEIDELLGER